MEIAKITRGDYGVSFAQYEEGMRVFVDDCIVPNLRAFKQSEDCVFLVYDGRFSTPDVPILEAKKWVSFIANCVAVSAGYTHFSDDAKKLEKFTVKSVGIGE